MDTDSDSDDEAAIHAADVVVPPPAIASGLALVLEKLRMLSVIACPILACCLTTSGGSLPSTMLHSSKGFFKVPIGRINDILTIVTAYNPYSKQKRDAAGRYGLTPLQKMCSSLRQFTSVVCSAEHDDKYRMAASTGMEQ
jgi:hypothetical protein